MRKYYSYFFPAFVAAFMKFKDKLICHCILIWIWWLKWQLVQVKIRQTEIYYFVWKLQKINFFNAKSFTNTWRKRENAYNIRLVRFGALVKICVCEFQCSIIRFYFSTSNFSEIWLFFLISVWLLYFWACVSWKNIKFPK